VKLKNIPIIRIFANWLDSANAATEGIIHAARTQRHIKFHLIVAFFVLFFCFIIGVEKIEFIMISLITLLVIVAEMFNSSLESVVNLVSPEKNETARIAKDISAGAVLICAIGAMIIGYLILWPYFLRMISDGFWIAKHHPENIAVLAIIIIMLTIIMLKAYLGKGHPLKGGFPSGHAATVFSIWVSSAYITGQTLVNILVLVAATAISLSRLHRKTHELLDVISGAAFGILITFLLYWIFY
jgi:diacylglycerol kinase (ATP)